MSTATKVGSLIKRTKVARLFAIPKYLMGRFRHAKRAAANVQLLHGSHLILKILLTGTILLITALLFLLAISFFTLGNTYVFGRMIFCVVVFAYLFYAVVLLRKQKYTAVAWMLLALYAGLATFILWQWSINAPIGILIFGFVIILAGTTLGARYIIPTSIGIVILLCSLQTAVSLGLAHPDRTSLALAPGFGDVASYGIIFAILALVAWLSGRRMEQSLKQALDAEAALEREKELLASRLEEQTRHLRESQLEEMRQLYRFAELGQLSTVLLHELANHLTVLTLDIEDLGQRHSRSKAISRAKESIGYLDTMVGQVRQQLQESNQPKEFNVLGLIHETVANLELKAKKSHVAIEFDNKNIKRAAHVLGDPLRLAQVITIIVTNAIESYATMPEKSRRIMIEATNTDHDIIIAVIDWGVGISAVQRQQLFEPFRTSKKSGMGIGLFIAKKMIETHFKGTVSLDDRTDCTKFAISLPEYQSSKK